MEFVHNDITKRFVKREDVEKDVFFTIDEVKAKLNFKPSKFEDIMSNNLIPLTIDGDTTLVNEKDYDAFVAKRNDKIANIWIVCIFAISCVVALTLGLTLGLLL